MIRRVPGVVNSLHVQYLAQGHPRRIDFSCVVGRLQLISFPLLRSPLRGRSTGKTDPVILLVANCGRSMMVRPPRRKGS